MNNRNLIEKTKEKYRKIGYIGCPAFEYEKIYFNKHGLNHLIRKRGIIRPFSEQIHKFTLFNNVPKIMKSIEVFHKHEIGNNIQFWSLVTLNSNALIKIIIRQIGNGKDTSSA